MLPPSLLQLQEESEVLQTALEDSTPHLLHVYTHLEIDVEAEERLNRTKFKMNGHDTRLISNNMNEVHDTIPGQ